MCGNHMDLKKRLDILEETVRNLQQECQRLYQTGFSNGVEVARKEYADELKRLEDMGFISCHGFLKPESKGTLDKLTEEMYNSLGVHADKLEPQSATKIANEAWQKWAEANVGKFERSNILTKEELYNQMKVTQIDPVEAEYFRQVDKAIKDTKER